MSGSVVVTGGARGIGRAIAERLASDGMSVVVVDLAEPRTQLVGSHGAIEVVVGDATVESVAERAADIATAAAPLVGWVNNAVQFRALSLTDDDPTAFWQAIETNVGAAVVGARVAIRRFLVDGTAGTVVNMSSLQARMAFPGWACYGMAKAAIEALTRAIAVDYGAQGIRSNAVAPGTVAVESYKEMLATLSPDRARDADHKLAAMHPLGRLATPDEVAAVVAFLLTPDAAFVSGATVAVDGGRAVFGGDPV